MEEQFPALLIVRGVNDVRRTDIHTAEPLVPEPSAFEIEMTFEKLKDPTHQVFIKYQQNLLKRE